MKKRLLILVALVLTMVMSISVALAHITTDSFSVKGRGFSISCWISDDEKDARASTTGGPGTYNKVSALFCWHDVNLPPYYSGYSGTSQDEVSGSTTASVYAPTLAGTSKKYYRVESNHRGEYDGDYREYNHLVVTDDD